MRRVTPHHYLDLSFYAIHAIELLYTIMGPGCETVTRVSGPNADIVVGRWRDGRIGTVQALQPPSDYGAVVFRTFERSPANILGECHPMDVLECDAKIAEPPLNTRVVVVRTCGCTFVIDQSPAYASGRPRGRRGVQDIAQLVRR